MQCTSLVWSCFSLSLSLFVVPLTLGFTRGILIELTTTASHYTITTTRPDKGPIVADINWLCTENPHSLRLDNIFQCTSVWSIFIVRMSEGEREKERKKRKLLLHWTRYSFFFHCWPCFRKPTTMMETYYYYYYYWTRPCGLSKKKNFNKRGRPLCPIKL